MQHALKFIASMPRFAGDNAKWLAALRRIEAHGFDTVSVSHHVVHGWQLGLVAAMAFAAASTTRLRVLSLVGQNDLQHPALLAKDIATIDALSGGRVELGIGAGWQPADYHALGLEFESAEVRMRRLAEALEVLRLYFTEDEVDFTGEHYRVNGMEALPRCVQADGPPVLVGAGGPRMLELAGRSAAMVGVHARLPRGRIDRNVVAELGTASIAAKIDRVRAAARSAGRPPPELQFSCYHVRVTDAPARCGPRSSWAELVESVDDVLADSPAVLVGTAAECAARLREWRDRLGITYWHLGADAETASRILEHV